MPEAMVTKMTFRRTAMLGHMWAPFVCENTTTIQIAPKMHPKRRTKLVNMQNRARVFALSE